MMLSHQSWHVSSKQTVTHCKFICFPITINKVLHCTLLALTLFCLKGMAFSIPGHNCVGDDSVMVMACAYNYSSHIFSNSISFSIYFPSLALVFQLFTCKILLAIYRTEDA